MACVRFLRHRGPAGLRDLFFCRNCGLYTLCARPFRVCEAGGGITTKFTIAHYVVGISALVSAEAVSADASTAVPRGLPEAST